MTFARLPAFKVALHGLLGERGGTQLLVTGARRGADAAAQLAIDLHDHLDQLLRERGRIAVAPASQVQRLALAELMPQAVADVRHDRRQAQHGDLQRFLAHGPRLRHVPAHGGRAR